MKAPILRSTRCLQLWGSEAGQSRAWVIGRTPRPSWTGRMSQVLKAWWLVAGLRRNPRASIFALERSGSRDSPSNCVRSGSNSIPWYRFLPCAIQDSAVLPATYSEAWLHSVALHPSGPYPFRFPAAQSPLSTADAIASLSERRIGGSGKGRPGPANSRGSGRGY